MGAAWLGSACAGPQRAGVQPRKAAYIVGRGAFAQLQRAQQLLAERKHSEARAVLDALVEQPGLNDHELALTWQLRGHVEADAERHLEASRALEACLARDALPRPTRLDVMHNLAQLYLATERHEQAGEMLAEWLRQADGASAEDHYLAAFAFTQAGEFARALPHAQKAVAGRSPVPEAWLQLLLANHYELKHPDEVEGLLKRLIREFPKKAYWLRLASHYAALDREDDALAVLELAHVQGYLTEERELLGLAQRYRAAGLPAKTVHVLDVAFERGHLARSAQSVELLALALFEAHRAERAVDAFAEAGGLSESGDPFVSAAQLLMQRADWDQARAMLVKAADKGQLAAPGKVHLLTGIATYHSGRARLAEASFRQAARYEPERAQAEHYLQVLHEERARCGASGCGASGSGH